MTPDLSQADVSTSGESTSAATSFGAKGISSLSGRPSSKDGSFNIGFGFGGCETFAVGRAVAVAVFPRSTCISFDSLGKAIAVANAARFNSRTRHFSFRYIFRSKFWSSLQDF